jgi:hypothetical protein
MGGPCDEKLTGGSEKEIMDAGWKHVEEKHPEIVEGIKSMSKEELDAWNAKLHETYEAAPEDAA